MKHFDNSSVRGVFSSMLALSAMGRVIAGVISSVLGTYFTVALWEQGVIWGVPIFFAFGGLFFLLIPGWMDLRRENERRRECEAVLSRESEIVSALLEAKRERRNPYRVLNEQRVRDFPLRQYLLEKAEQLLRQERPCR